MMSKNRPPSVDYLFMDCNSIVYDSFYLLKSKQESITDESVIQQVIFRLWEIIQYISPQEVVYITFDGVAPLSKMKQQKTRRLKTAVAEEESWSTSCISPGTSFMQKLSQSVKQEFTFKERELGVRQILLSTSEECGEGEHKLFAWLRKNHPKQQQQQQQQNLRLLVYGMDADLIMLTLLHIPWVTHAWVFREPPTPKTNDTSTLHFTFVDIVQMGAAIRQEMRLQTNLAIREYIFLCFFLGNDFMPHFPSMNIRTHGIPTLLEVYRKLVGNETNKKYFIHPNSGEIQWSTVRRFIDLCAPCEHEWLLQEYKTRDKMRHQLVLDPNEKEIVLLNAPLLMRGAERYIRPQAIGWRERYYETLFPPETNPKKVVSNFLEGLQWVYLYYTEGCTDWRWQYEYSYAPLWTDLSKHFASPPKCKVTRPFTQEEQLAYIMPPKNAKELTLKYQWSFCRYLWEGETKVHKAWA